MKKIIITASLICALVVTGWLVPETAVAFDFSSKNLPPSLVHPFGTDWMGRDLFFRTLKGLSTSIVIGTVASLCSGLIALAVGVTAGLAPPVIDRCLMFLVDMMLSLPHLLLQLLLAYALGGGVKGVLLSLILTHWTSLARLVRSQVLQLKEMQYVKSAKKFGKSSCYIACHHILPPVLPQALVGIVLAFPHTILHEASLTFLGFGLSPEQWAIGVMLSESVSHLASGNWWLLWSGVCLALVVLLFDRLGQGLKESILFPSKGE